MKQITVLLVIALTLSGCSSDDIKDDLTQNDPIIGKWSRLEYGLCAPWIFEFTGNNTIISESYGTDRDGNCQLDTNDYEYHNWTKTTGQKYVIKSKIKDLPEVSEVFSVTFKNDIMTWAYPDGETLDFKKL